MRGVPPRKDQMVNSFSSKSEPALNLSTSGHCDRAFRIAANIVP